MWRLVLLAGWLLAIAPFAHAQPALEAHRLAAEASLTLDGQFTEPAWSRAPAASGFTQQEPVEGGTPSQRTVVRVLFDETHLYIGARLHYDDPSAIAVNKRQRDASLNSDDRLMWVLDTYNDGRDAYFFETNAAGLRGDGLLASGQGININKSWDAIWDVAVHRGAFGWSAEIRIPFSALQFDPQQTTWGFNVQRTIRAKNEEILWAGFKRNQGLFRPRFAGELRGLTGLSQGLGLEVKPYALATSQRDWTTGDATPDVSADAGGTLQYSFTPTLRGALTINTDFAQVEVDERRVNLTRFPLFFPEKRDFFLDGSTVFEFAPRSAQYPYFSRRIGLVAGQPIPILGGLRLNGRTGRYNLGLVQIRTRETPNVRGDTLTQPAEDFTAARVVRNVGSESQVGVIYTRRASHPDAPGSPFTRLNDRHTVGADMELATSELFGDQNLQFQAFFVWHNAPLKADTSDWDHRTTRGIRLNYPNVPWFGHVSYREFGNAYDPAVGFVARRNFRRVQPSIGYAPVLEQHPWIRQLTFEIDAEYLTDLTMEPQTTSLTLTPMELLFESSDQIEVNVQRQFERLNRPFDILGDGRIVLPPGTYTTWGGRAGVRTADYRLLSASADVNYGGFWSGTRTELEAELTMRPLTGLNLAAEWEHTRARLDEGDFSTHVLRFNGTVAPTPDVSLRTQVQYDNVSDRIGLFARLRWIVRPGSDLFLVYTRNWRTLGERLTPLSSEAAAKLTYTTRF